MREPLNIIQRITSMRVDPQQSVDPPDDPRQGTPQQQDGPQGEPPRRRRPIIGIIPGVFNLSVFSILGSIVTVIGLVSTYRAGDNGLQGIIGLVTILLGLLFAMMDSMQRAMAMVRELDATLYVAIKSNGNLASDMQRALAEREEARAAVHALVAERDDLKRRLDAAGAAPPAG